MNAFTSIAEFYELLSDSEARLRREASLLEECLRQAPGQRVVDVACGTGFHAKFFAEHGARVSAIDLSPEMVAHARETCRDPRINYSVGDMRDPVGGPWDLAVCLGNSLSLLPTPDDLRKTMDSLYGLLSPGGIFLVQVLNYQSAAAREPRHRIEKRAVEDGAETSTAVVAIKNLVPYGDRTLLALTFFSVQEDGCFTASDAALLMNLSLEQIQGSASAAGFQIDRVYGGFDRREYNPENSPDLIMVLRKPV